MQKHAENMGYMDLFITRLVLVVMMPIYIIINIYELRIHNICEKKTNICVHSHAFMLTQDFFLSFYILKGLNHMT